MKRYITLAAVLAFATSNLFAFGALPLDTKKNETNKLGEILADKKTKQENTKKVEHITGVFMGANAADQNFQRIDFSEKALKVSFFADGGSIIYDITKNSKFDTADVNMQTKNRYGNTSDPHAPMDVIAVITLLKNGKEVQTSSITVTIVEALDLNSGVYGQPTTHSTVSKDQNGSCTRCGARDPYHCNSSATGPCDKATTKKPAKKAEAKPENLDHSDCDRYHCKHNGYIGPCVDDKVYDYKGPAQKNHAKDCKDPYHCDCPEVSETKAAVAKVPTKVVTEFVTMHKDDCFDQYHCTCPTKEVKRTVNKDLVDEKVHKSSCIDKYHCDCPTKKVYR